MTSTAFQSDLHRQNAVRALGIKRPESADSDGYEEVVRLAA
jgi:hypothetical protein